ncbi:MAG: hypothetical protein WC612_00780 [Bdellovibrionales bacterium]|jgi:hypothetical protein
MTTTTSSDTLLRSFGKAAKKMGERALALMNDRYDPKVPLLFNAAVIGGGLASPWGLGANATLTGLVMLAGNVALHHKRVSQGPYCMAVVGGVMAFMGGIALLNNQMERHISSALLNSPAGSIEINLGTTARETLAADGDSRTVSVSQFGEKAVYTAYKIEGQWYASNVDTDLSCRDENTLVLTGVALMPDGTWNQKEKKELYLSVATDAPIKQASVSIGGETFTPVDTPCEAKKAAFIKRAKASGDQRLAPTPR